MDSTPRKLPDTELEVMQAVWQCEPPAARGDIEAILKDTHPMAATTLLTLLSRLADKGFVRVEKQGRSSVYYPLVTKKEYLGEQGRRFFSQLCGGSVSTFANALCDSGLSEDDIAQLREILERRKI